MIFLLLSLLHASVCTQWGKPIEIGLLPHKQINEASGLQVSKKIKDRMYHVNDSGEGPIFFVTDTKGANLQVVKVEDFYPVDAEDMTIASYNG
ncbi:MAG: hypothetical protein KDD37_08470, partial [Bdellovibrionales bacterium]|nr:hypothetical protein [Bdellovibrionales bacterium]